MLYLMIILSNCLHIAADAYQDVHVWSALLTCVRPLWEGTVTTFGGGGAMGMMGRGLLCRGAMQASPTHRSRGPWRGHQNPRGGLHRLYCTMLCAWHMLRGPDGQIPGSSPAERTPKTCPIPTQPQRLQRRPPSRTQWDGPPDSSGRGL